MQSSHKFKHIVISLAVGWLLVFVFLPNVMIIGTSFLTRDDAHFVSLVSPSTTILAWPIRSMLRY